MMIVIPARFHSTRLPGKPLQDVAGKPLIQRVYECAAASGAGRIVVATDDERIRGAAQGFGAEVCMTAPTHRSGTDRIAEVAERLGLGEAEIVVNLQGDEPLMPPTLLREVAEALAAHPDAVMATACHPIEDLEAFHSPNVVKVVRDRHGYALYFSRAPIPWPRDNPQDIAAAQRHIGLYAYRAGFLRRVAGWPACELEQVEQLEQLRVLWHGERIIVVRARALPGPGVDTPEDLARVRRHFQGSGAL